MLMSLVLFALWREEHGAFSYIQAGSAVDMCCYGETISCPWRAPQFAAVSRMNTRLVFGPVYRHGSPKPYEVDHPRASLEPTTNLDYAVPVVVVKRPHGSGPHMVPEHLVAVRSLTSAQAQASTDDLVTDDRWQSIRMSDENRHTQHCHRAG